MTPGPDTVSTPDIPITIPEVLDMQHAEVPQCPDCSEVCQVLQDDIATFMEDHSDQPSLDDVQTVVHTVQCPSWQKYLAFTFIMEHMVIVLALLVYCFCCKKK